MATKKELKEIQGLMDELGGRLQALAVDAGEEALDASSQRVEELRAQLAALMGTARERGRVAVDRAREASKQADKYAHDNPWQVAAGAVVLGVALGYLISSSQRGR